MTDPILLPSSNLVDLAARLLAAAGLSATGAQTVAGSLVDADERGTHSHGVMLLPMYVDRLLAGSVSTRDAADVVMDLGAVAVLDADNMPGQLSSDQAIRMAVDKALKHGVGVVTVRNAFHFGAAARYVTWAADRGCIAVAMSNTRPLMPAPGGTTPVVGNNPIAIGVPRTDGDPIVLDMALSAAALGKIRLAAQAGQPIPATWATDSDGRVTTDPNAAIEGMLLPIGGPKGFGLALMVDVLTGVLAGGGHGGQVAGLYADTGVPNNCSHTFIALSVAAFGTIDDFGERMTELASEITGSRSAEPGGRVVLPGDLEKERARISASSGVALGPEVCEALVTLADRLNVDISEFLPEAVGPKR